MAAVLLRAGHYLGISGMVTFKKADNVREVLSDLPLDRLLVETDTPYLAPQPHRDQTNEPAFIAETGAALAEVWGIGADEVASLTAATAQRHPAPLCRARLWLAARRRWRP